MKLISGNGNLELSQAISKYLDLQLTPVTIQRFPDSEIFVEIEDNVRGEDVFFVQPTSHPANDNLMELLIAIDALRRGSARRVTAVLPYFGYGRQDRKTGPRTPISAKLVANLITKAGADRVLALDLHAGQIQGFFDIPTDNLIASPDFAHDLRQRLPNEELVIVSPDVGGMLRARDLSARMGAELAVIDKRRRGPGFSEVMNIIGDVSGRHCIMVDDIVDSAGTLTTAATALREKGAVMVSAYVTHGVLSGQAVERIGASFLESLVITDSIKATEAVRACPKLRQISVAPLLGEAILRISEERSVSSLFD